MDQENVHRPELRWLYNTDQGGATNNINNVNVRRCEFMSDP